jgi:hypothetical protein
MGFGVLKVTVSVNVYWDMTSFSLADKYNSYVEKSRSGFSESLESVNVKMFQKDDTFFTVF